MSSVLPLISKQITIYLGIPILITGVIGGILNTIVFLSLRTFRESSCICYMIIMSCANVGQLITGLLTRILIAGFEIDLTQGSEFYCKFRVYCLQVCALVSLTCYCLATIDQYLATCSRLQWQQWCTIKIAIRLSLIAIILWILHGIPYLIYYNIIVQSSTGKSVCTLTNTMFSRYVTYFYQMIMISCLPVCISVVFGFLAYRNVQHLAYRTIPLVRRELDKQLTTMVLYQVLFNIFTLIPYFIFLIISFQIPSNSDSTLLSAIQLANAIIILVYYIYYAVSLKKNENNCYLVFGSFRIHFSSICLHRIDFVVNFFMFFSKSIFLVGKNDEQQKIKLNHKVKSNRIKRKEESSKSISIEISAEEELSIDFLY